MRMHSAIEIWAIARVELERALAARFQVAPAGVADAEIVLLSDRVRKVDAAAWDAEFATGRWSGVRVTVSDQTGPVVVTLQPRGQMRSDEREPARYGFLQIQVQAAFGRAPRVALAAAPAAGEPLRGGQAWEVARQMLEGNPHCPIEPVRFVADGEVSEPVVRELAVEVTVRLPGDPAGGVLAELPRDRGRPIGPLRVPQTALFELGDEEGWAAVLGPAGPKVVWFRTMPLAGGGAIVSVSADPSPTGHSAVYTIPGARPVEIATAASS